VNPHYAQVAEMAGHRCEYCGAPEVVFNFPFEVEHIDPAAAIRDETSNWALACRACNVRKSNHLDGADPETGSPVPLFHPRKHTWHEHFRVDISSGEIFGLTPVGRASIARLQMNLPNQLAARMQWIRLGLFP
jgi:hypothetical protein